MWTISTAVVCSALTSRTSNSATARRGAQTCLSTPSARTRTACGKRVARLLALWPRAVPCLPHQDSSMLKGPAPAVRYHGPVATPCMSSAGLTVNVNADISRAALATRSSARKRVHASAQPSGAHHTTNRTPIPASASASVPVHIARI